MYSGNTLAETTSNRGDRPPLLLEMRGKRFPGVEALNDVPSKSVAVKCTDSSERTASAQAS
jgi:hypothetical protein